MKDVSMGCLYVEYVWVFKMHVAHAHWTHATVAWYEFTLCLVLVSLHGIPCPSLDVTHQYRESGTTMTIFTTQVIELLRPLPDELEVWHEFLRLLPDVVRFRRVFGYRGW